MSKVFSYSYSYLAVSFLVLVLVVVTTKEEVYCIGSYSHHRNLQYEEICCNPKYVGEILKIPGEGLRQKYIHCPSTLPSGCILEEDCKEIFSLQSSPASGYYNIQLDNGTVVSVYCDMEGTNCDGEGGWTRIVRLNMTEPNASCLAGLMQMDYDNIDHAVCANSEFIDNNYFDCQSFFYGMGINYSKICGQVRGYTLQSTPYGLHEYGDIDNPYVDGISITRGTPHQHVWTFAAGYSEDNTYHDDCPCNDGSRAFVPSSVGNDYYCESSRYHNFSDPLWDGKQCGGLEYPCCTNPQLPWFIKSFNEELDDDIEMRLCTGKDYGQIHIDILELFVK